MFVSPSLLRFFRSLVVNEGPGLSVLTVVAEEAGDGHIVVNTVDGFAEQFGDG
jgi:hypothetical protein